jgi:hypothetical protein
MMPPTSMTMLFSGSATQKSGFSRPLTLQRYIVMTLQVQNLTTKENVFGTELSAAVAVQASMIS